MKNKLPVLVHRFTEGQLASKRTKQFKYTRKSSSVQMNSQQILENVHLFRQSFDLFFCLYNPTNIDDGIPEKVWIDKTLYYNHFPHFYPVDLCRYLLCLLVLGCHESTKFGQLPVSLSHSHTNTLTLAVGALLRALASSRRALSYSLFSDSSLTAASQISSLFGLA